MSLFVLPTELLLLVIQYLEPVEVLRLCSTCKPLNNLDEVKYSARYWSAASKTRFRVQNQPTAEADGKRWLHVYRRLLRQSKVYAWGNNDKCCLGGTLQVQGFVNGPARPHAQPAAYVIPKPRSVELPMPLEKNMGRAGTVSELQCGGWSTTMLTSKGAIFIVGTVDGLTYRQLAAHEATMLSYPHGFPSPLDRYAAYTAIRQFSTGRCHVLGLSDSGRIWTWDDANRTGLHVKFLSTTTRESMDGSVCRGDGYVTKVVAGWNKSSAYVEGTGIVVWMPSNVSELQGHSDQSELDLMVVYHHFNIPQTGHPSGSAQGKVINWIVLEQFVVLLRENGKVFAIHIPDDIEETENTTTSEHPFQIYPPSHESSEDSPSASTDNHVTDIQGSFRSFAILKSNGQVLISDQTYLAHLWSLATSPSYPSSMHNLPALPDAEPFGLRRYPSLQHTGVVSVAFGDHHFLALHKDGSITAHGVESKQCGALGLGADVAARARGLRELRPWQLQSDRGLLWQCETSGRRVAFESEKNEWIEALIAEETGGLDGGEDWRVSLVADTMAHDEGAVLSERIERRLVSWEEGPPGLKSEGREHAGDDADEDDALPAHFALSVAAGGWHSGALVLVNEEKAARVRAKYWKSNEAADSASVTEASRTSIPSDVATPQMDDAAKKKGSWAWEGRAFSWLQEGNPSSDNGDDVPEWEELKVYT